MNSEFIQTVLSRGEAGKVWLESIPFLIERYQKLWNITVSEPYKLSYNYVAPAKRADDSNAVLKIGFPQDPEFQTEMQALQVFNGEGMVKLLESDPEASVMLIEQVQPGIPLSQMKNDEEATRIMARVMKQLWKPLPDSHNFISVADWSQAFPKLRERYQGTTGPLPAHLVDKAESLFQELIATSATPMLVHGDLHQDNVLSSQRGGWLAIDPKGIAAEPAYEVAAMIRNPFERLKDIENLEPLLQKRIKILAEELGFDKNRILNWCFAQTVLSAVWNVEETKGPEHALRVAEVLDTMEA